MATKKKSTVIKKPEPPKCAQCTKPITTSTAYKSYGLFAIGDRLPICKDCVLDIYEQYWEKHKDSKLAVFFTCRKIDVPFVTGIYEMALTTMENLKNKNQANREFVMSPAFAFYMSRVFTTPAIKYGNPKVFDDGEQFVDGKGQILSMEDSKNPYDATKNDKDFLVKMIKKWGQQRDCHVTEYMFLEKEYEMMVKSYGEPKDYSTEMFFKDIAIINLDVKKCREDGRPYNTLIDLRNKLIKSANIDPIDPNSAERTPPIGLVTKMIENNKPIILKDDRYKDVDGLGELRMQVVGQLAKMMGKNNNVTKAYEEYLNKHSVDLEQIQKDIADSVPDESVIDDFDEDIDIDYDDDEDGKE